MQRKLVAILAADIVGYTRLAGADEDNTLARLRALRSDLIDPAISVHHGRVVKRTGDGILIEFRSVVDAVRCAIEVQNGMVERNAGLPPERRIEFRVGIHLGDVVEESDGDLMGDGVNIAARLEGIAKPGAICLSEDAYRQVKVRLDLAVSDLGEQSLKNIAEPMRVYSVEVGKPAHAQPVKPAPAKPRNLLIPIIAAMAPLILIAGGAAWYFAGGPKSTTPSIPQPTAASTPAELAGQAAPEPPRLASAHLSIVVLPFANLSGDPSQDYFGDGITEDLTTDLSRVSGSFVIARNTAFTFKGKNVNVKEIGKQLGVRYVLEGSIRRDRDRVRVNVQLIDAETGSHLWAERFDKPLSDLFGMQDEIVASLANQLGAQLVTAEARRAERAPHPDSTDLYYQGLAWFNKGDTREYLMQARGFFEHALALDSGNLDALVGTGQVDAILGAAFLTDDRATRLAAAEATLTKVLLLAPNNAVAHQYMGLVLVQTKRAAQGITEHERSLTLDPNLAESRAFIGMAKLLDGRAEETQGDENEALRLSPRDSRAWLWMHLCGAAKLHLGADEDAVAWFRRAIELKANISLTHFFLAAALTNLGKLEEARAETQAGLALNPTFTIRRFRLGAESDNPVFLKQRERLMDGMRKAGVPEG
jgi:TolB-like protein/class 3 adenylate cyclase/Flp pilus assembly protein TadD